MSEQALVQTFQTSFDVAKHRFVTLRSDGKVAQSVNSGRILGVNRGPVVHAGEQIDVGIFGIFEVEASGIIRAGERVASSNGGRVKTCSSGEKAGIALSASKSNGCLVRVLLQQ